jgi:hypothetical protein
MRTNRMDPLSVNIDTLLRLVFRFLPMLPCLSSFGTKLTAVYLINRLPSKVIQSQTPIERLHGDKSDYSFLRIFGCPCWPNLRPYNKHKLEFRSKQCAFLGYSNVHKGYKCLDISTGRVYISRDVVFDETVFPFASLHSNAGAWLRAEINLLPHHLQPSILHGHEERVLQANPDVNPTTTVPAKSADFSVRGDVCAEFLGSGTSTEADSGGSQSSLARSPSGSHMSDAQGPCVPGALG